MKDKEDIVYDQFKEMEKRYHTWMNCYSLFNGALLVAYCTILVSTRQVIEMGGGISTNNGLSGNARLFQLECTYWNILALIAFLGCVASYCWYLSAIGHYYWIECWRKGLNKKENIESLLELKNIDLITKHHYHSTFKITKIFIATVLYSWILVTYNSLKELDFELNLYDISIVSIIWILLLLFERLTIHWFIGSDLSRFNTQETDSCFIYMFQNVYTFSKKYATIGFLIIWLIFSIIYVCNNDGRITNRTMEKTLKIQFE